MSRPIILNDAQKIFITSLKTKEPDLTAREIASAVLAWLVSSIENETKHSLDIEDVQCIWEEQVSETAIIRFLTSLKPRMEKSSPLDKPWSLATLEDYPVRPEVLPLLLKLQATDLTTTIGLWARDKYHLPREKKLSIRVARWFNRLWGLPRRLEEQNAEGHGENETRLRYYRTVASVAVYYALFENIFEKAGLPFQTLTFDAPDLDMMMGNFSNYFEQRYHNPGELEQQLYNKEFPE
jgi:hypothetical protein